MATNLNQRFFDAAARHQLYLEGVKLGQFRQFQRVLQQIATLIRRAVVGLSVENLSELTKRQLTKLLRDIRQAQTRLLTNYGKEFTAWLQEFLLVDRDLTAGIYEELTDDDYGAAIGIYPKKATVLTKAGAAALWALIRAETVSGTGQTIAQMFGTLQNSTLNLVEQTIRRGVADKWTKTQLINELIGTPEKKFRDGVLGRINRSAATEAFTSIQHVSQTVRAAVFSGQFNIYRWVSVIDAVTTQICRSRSNHIYEYGKGPLPPAHYNCRSSTAPVTAADLVNPPKTFFDWLKSQPDSVLTDILGKKQAAAFKNGSARAKDYPKGSYNKELTLKQFSGKLNLIAAE